MTQCVECNDQIAVPEEWTDAIRYRVREGLCWVCYHLKSSVAIEAKSQPPMPAEED